MLTHVIMALLRGQTRIGFLFPELKNADRPAALHMYPARRPPYVHKLPIVSQWRWTRPERHAACHSRNRSERSMRSNH